MMNEIRIGNDCLRYRDQGNGPAIIFLHGALANANTWRKISGAVSRHFRCIMPDLPLGGHALPFSTQADLSPPGIAGIIDRFIDALGLPSVILVASDTGGAYAQIYAALHPQKVSRMVLANCDALEIFPPRQFASLPRLVQVPGYLLAMATLFRFKPFLKTPMVLGLLSRALSKEEIHQLYVKSFIDNPGVRRDFRKAASGWSARHTMQAADALSSFDKPVLLLWGDDDKQLFPEALGRRLASVFPNAKFELVSGAMSFVQEDQPEQFSARLLAFLLPNADASQSDDRQMPILIAAHG